MGAVRQTQPVTLRALPRLERKCLRRPDTLATQVCDKYGVTFEAVAGWVRGGQVDAARRELARELRAHTRMTLREIGAYLGGRDHTTILYLLRTNR